jgi:hypothetical protein
VTFWRHVFGPRGRVSTNREQDADRELRTHLDLEAEELRASGLGHDDATRAAGRTLGNTTLIREEIRDVWTWTSLEQLAQDCRYACRTLVKNPGFSVVALLSLALGIGANTAIFTFVNAAFFKPLSFPEAERIVALQQRPIKGTATGNVHPRSFVPWQDRAKSFEALAIAQMVPVNTEGADGAEQVPGLWASQDFFRVFSVQPFLGRGFSPDAGLSRSDVREGRVPGNGEIILSHGYWQRKFGADTGVVGKSMPVGKDSAVIIGVMPPGFRVGSLNVDIYSPMRIDRSKPEAVGSRSFMCFGRLRPGITLESARAEMEVLASQVAQEDANEKNWGVVVLGLRDYLVRENRATLMILSGGRGIRFVDRLRESGQFAVDQGCWTSKRA